MTPKEIEEIMENRRVRKEGERLAKLMKSHTDALTLTADEVFALGKYIGCLETWLHEDAQNAYRDAQASYGEGYVDGIWSERQGREC